jgi:hypothetical protein
MPRLFCVPISFCCAFIMFIIAMPIFLVANAVQLDGVEVSTTLQVGGKTLYLNGYGLRTYSILGIHIYAASLYLEHLSDSADEIIQSPETKLLVVRFERNIVANEAREAWRKGLENNCLAPCHLDPEDLERFLAAVPAMHAGDYFDILFEQNIATVTANGKQIGTIPRRQFAEAVLATFLGPNPASTTLRDELLRRHS